MRAEGDGCRVLSRSMATRHSSLVSRFGNHQPLWAHSALIWTISDLHLSFATPKPMDIFGDRWRDHPQRIAAAWNERVRADDTVLIAGDISWALKLADARQDLEWIAALPGRKILS